MSIKCRECGDKLQSLRHAKRHYRREHGGELDTPEEYLPDDDSEQRDFDGEQEPDESDHDPEYESKNDPPETDGSSLFDYDAGEQ